jgi:hypothetical protein
LLCKHRIDLLSGDITNLVRKSDVSVVEKFLSSIEMEKIDSLFAELVEIEKEIERLTKLKSKFKKNIGIRLCEGF